MRLIYLDNAATTQVAPEAAEIMNACLRSDFGNPASAHHVGMAAERRVKEARAQLLRALGDPQGELGEILWTSGGNEADALGVMGAARAQEKREILYSALEHAAVCKSALLLGREGFTSRALPILSSGILDVSAAMSAVSDKTCVVALMLVNNEIGTVQPVAELAGAIKAHYPDVHVHCDAVQALGKVGVDVRSLGVDSLALSAHKLHGPKGVGALWLRKGARVEPLWGGGGHQNGLRSGTLNVPGIAGMGEAVRLSQEGLGERRERWIELGRMLVDAAARSGIAYRVNGTEAPRSPHVMSLSFADIPAEQLLHVLESRGVLVSAGSACASRSRTPSAVLQAISVPPSYGTIRFSFGRTTTREEVAEAAEILIEVLRDF